MTRDAEVLIVGAGVAGLAAARLLSREGRSVLVLEARERLGGRIHTVRDPRLPLPVELGAEFIHGEPPHIWQMIDEHALGACEITGEEWCRNNGALERCGFFEDLQQMLQGMADAPDQPFQQYLEHCDCHPNLKPWAARYIEGFNAAHADLIGTRALAEESRASRQIHGERAFRLLDGYESLVRVLRREIHPERSWLHLNTVVEQVEWSRGKVKAIAHTRTGEPRLPFSAERAVITLPLGVLQSGAVLFSPEPPGLRDQMALLEMGQAVRVTLRFRSQFWNDQMGFLFSQDDWMPTWWTAFPVRAPVITGWAAGPHAARFLGHETSFVVEKAMAALARLLDRRPAELQNLLEAWYVHDWHADPFARGAYSYAKVGGSEARRALAEPIEDTLYFAGEACDTEGHGGTVHGAIASGERAARAITANAARKL